MAETFTQSDSELPSMPNNTGRSYFGLIISLLALLLIIILAVVMVKFWYFYQNDVQQIHSQVDQLQQTVQQSNEQNMQQQQMLLNIKATMQQLQRQQDRNKDWVLDEVRHLVQLADFNLNFANNVSTAIQLLKLADERLQVVSAPNITTLRQALADSITALNAVPKVDTVGLVVRLNAMSQQLSNLPITPNQITAVKQVVNQNNNEIKPLSAWHRVWQNFWQSLQGLVIIRTQAPSTPAILAPQQQTYLIENIRLQFSQAQWAVLHQQSEIYQQSLQQAQQWIQQYFLANSSAVQAMLNSISELQKVNIKPNLPNVNNVLQIVNQLQAKSNAAKPQPPKISSQFPNIEPQPS